MAKVYAQFFTKCYVVSRCFPQLGDSGLIIKPYVWLKD